MTARRPMARVAAAAAELADALRELAESEEPTVSTTSKKRPRPPVVLTETDIALARRTIRRLRAAS